MAQGAAIGGARVVGQLASLTAKRPRLGPAWRFDRPLVMGPSSTSPPDSFFSDGGDFRRPPLAPSAAGRAMLAEGADIVDIGGESTRPGRGTSVA